MPVPVAMRTTPIYLTNGRPVAPDNGDPMFGILICITVAVALCYLYGPASDIVSGFLSNEHKSAASDYVPFSHRGPLSWAWMLVSSSNDW